MVDTFSTDRLENREAQEISHDSNYYEAEFKKFLCWLLKEREPADAECNPDLNKVPLFIFVSKKGYWIYRLMEDCLRNEGELIWQNRLCAENIVVKSDRYFTKMVTKEEFPQILSHRRIYVVDDFLIFGQNISRFCNLIRKKAYGSRIIPVVFAQWEGFRSENNVLEFEELCYHIKNASLSEIGRLSTWETQRFHQSGIPYVIDLPFLTLTNTEKDQPRTFFSGTLTSEQFQLLCNAQSSLWQHEDNSYTIADYRVKSVFFYFQHDQFQNKFRNLIQNLVVKCQYDNSAADGTVSVTFTPFAILRSVKQDELICFVRAAYSETKYGRLLEDYLESGFAKSADENLNTALYRAIVFFLSRYISINFKNHLQKILGMGLDLQVNELEKHWPTEFIDSLPDLFEAQFKERLSCLYEQNDIMPYIPPLQNRSERQSINMYFDIFFYFAMYKKMADQEQQFCSLEELENEISIYRQCSLENNEFKTAFTSALLQLLNQGVISNQILYDKDTGFVLRGFRLGENGTLLLPFNQKAVFSAIHTYYTLMGCRDARSQDELQAVYRSYFKNYPMFKLYLLKFIRESELDSYFDLREAEDMLSYFGMISENALKQQVENKTYIVQDLERSESMDSKVAQMLTHYVRQMNFE